MNQGMLEVIKQGSIEPLIVNLRDRLEGINDLGTDVTNLRFDVIAPDGTTVKISNGIPTTSGMKAICLIDTTTGGGWADGEYSLWIKYTDGSASPILFAGKFRVEVDY